jgi:hypothetical protein
VSLIGYAGITGDDSFWLSEFKNPDRLNVIFLGICFLRGALEVAVEGIGDGEKGG